MDFTRFYGTEAAKAISGIVLEYKRCRRNRCFTRGLVCRHRSKLVQFCDPASWERMSVVVVRDWWDGDNYYDDSGDE